MTNLFGEFFGTTVLLLFGCGVVANVLLHKSKGENSGWIVIVTGWAMAVMLGVFAAQATGAPQADINPAVTLAKTFMGVYTWPQALATMGVQLLGGMAGATLVWLAYLPHWAITLDKRAKLAVFATSPAIRNTISNLLCEIIATTALIVAIFTIFSPRAAMTTPGLGPYLLGMLVWGLGLSLGGPTGSALNPARDLGPRIAHFLLPIAGKGDSDWGYAWIPVVGPMIGGGVAFVIGQAIGVI